MIVSIFRKQVFDMAHSIVAFITFLEFYGASEEVFEKKF